MRKVTEIRSLDNFRLWLRFDDGVTGEVDLSDLEGKGVFSTWVSHSDFGSATIGDSGEVAWEGGGDLCPDSLYMRITGKTVAELFPSRNLAPLPSS